MTDKITLIDYNTLSRLGDLKDQSHLIIKNHKVLDLEQIQIIEVDGVTNDFQTLVCFNRKCNYIEFRLKESHTEDK